MATESVAVTEQEVVERARLARKAARTLARQPTAVKDAALERMAQALEADAAEIVRANEEDVSQARARGLREALVDRLALDGARVAHMAEALRKIARLPDPVGEVVRMWRRPNGLEIGQVRVPIGVIGMIYESRPNVTVDAAGLCLKTGNAVVFRGGSDALTTNQRIVAALRRGAAEGGVPADAIQLIESTDRASAEEMMRLVGLIDVLIPRGGPGLIQTVVQQARVPVIETGVGNCHAYVDVAADLDMAERIVMNGKVQRPGVCNALETLLVHEGVAERFLPRMAARLAEAGVEMRGCPRTLRLVPQAVEATEDDWATEFLDLVIAVRVVDSLDEALEHIETYGTRHSEVIITNDYSAARRFQQTVDAAVVYVNASTRFTDGEAFGFGAEIGISTQTLHARGPMGLPELTSTKYIVSGEGQVRA